MYFQLKSPKYWWPSRCLLGSQPPIAMLTISWEISIAMVTASCWCHPDQVVGVERSVLHASPYCIPLCLFFRVRMNTTLNQNELNQSYWGIHLSLYSAVCVNHVNMWVWEIFGALLVQKYKVIPNRRTWYRHDYKGIRNHVV